jgi:hypothetical protein
MLRKGHLEKGTPEAVLEARRDALEDVIWSLLTGKEFLFNY